MPILFQNQMPEKLAEELELARKLGIKPKFLRNITDLDEEFAQICNTEIIKWVLNENSELAIMPKLVGNDELPHTILTGGKAVLAAGEAQIVVSIPTAIGIFLNNKSGHYKPNRESLTKGKAFFAKLGIRFPGR